MSSSPDASLCNKITKKNKYKVIAYNDDVTTYEFVVRCFMTVFNKTEKESSYLAIKIHNVGEAVVSYYDTKEEASNKAREAVDMARSNNFPLYLSSK